MTKPNKDITNMNIKHTQLKKKFEAHMLDGDKVEDCGKAMLLAESVWDFIHSAVEEAREEVVEEVKQIAENWGRKAKVKDGKIYAVAFFNLCRELSSLSHKKETKNNDFEIPDDMEDFDLNGDRIPIKKETKKK